MQNLPSDTTSTAEQAPGCPVPARPRILVMDDEACILELITRALNFHGYEVEPAPNGAAAVSQYRDAMDGGRPFDLVILDLAVPEGMGGFDAFMEIRTFDPGVKAILSSGYTHEPIILNYKKHGIAGVAPKPYKVKELIGAVEDVLGAGKSA